MMSESGRTYGREDINKMIVEHQNKMISEAGHMPLNPDRQLKPTTLQNYAAELAMNSNLSLTQTSISKTNTRHSIRGVVNNVIFVANTHFVEVDEEDIDIRNELKEVMPETRELYDLITDSRGGIPAVLIRPALITSTDDSTVFIFCGSITKKDEFRLISKESCLNRGTNAVYNVDECDHMNDMRVKLTWTLSGGGTSASLFVTVTGLNDREMQTECDMLVVEVPDLCVGVCGVGGNERLVTLYSARMGMTKRDLNFTRRMRSYHLSTLCIKNIHTLMFLMVHQYPMS
jgi:hypothetical protein